MLEAGVARQLCPPYMTVPYNVTGRAEADILRVVCFLGAADDAVRAHSSAKGVGVVTEEERGPVVSFYAPSSVLKRTEDMLLFHFGEGFDVIACRDRYLA